MTQRLIFHIGDFKTGTSSIQDWVNAGQAAPRGLYPCPINAHALAHHIRDPETADIAFAEFAHALAKSDGHILISSEHFEACDPARLDDLLRRYLPRLRDDVMILAYLRPHAEALVARYAESTKIGSYHGNLSGYLDWKPSFWRLRMAARLRPWRAVFGHRLVLRLYDPRLFTAGDVRHDLLRAIFGRAGPPLRPLIRNRTPSLKALAALVLLQTRMRAQILWREGDYAQTHARMMGRHLAEWLGTSARFMGPLPYCDGPTAARLWSGYRADARDLDRAFAGAPFTLAMARALDQARDLPPFDLASENWLEPDEIAELTELSAKLAQVCRSEDQSFALAAALAERAFPSVKTIRSA
ncbi:hypothetical protein OE810_08185 [Rhodobacteraceae bacterium XHP0102]|nr:hypothetical protein [Rhodobacteraceae bacterium XHP0102]